MSTEAAWAEPCHYLTTVLLTCRLHCNFLQSMQNEWSHGSVWSTCRFSTCRVRQSPESGDWPVYLGENQAKQNQVKKCTGWADHAEMKLKFMENVWLAVQFDQQWNVFPADSWSDQGGFFSRVFSQFHMCPKCHISVHTANEVLGWGSYVRIKKIREDLRSRASSR